MWLWVYEVLGECEQKRQNKVKEYCRMLKDFNLCHLKQCLGSHIL